MNEFKPQAKDIDKDAQTDRLEQRRLLYPGLYKTNDEAQEAIEKYAVVDLANFRKRPRLDSCWQRLENSNVESATGDLIPAKEEIADEGAASSLQKPIYSNADIWGAIPRQEPKYLVECQLCGRQVSVSRFAPHLDKCMGLGMVRGAVGNGATRGANVNR